MAVDERIKAAAPVNMVSAFMQGGCRCENQGHLRLDINNVEIASCMAPRPLLMVSCNWRLDGEHAGGRVPGGARDLQSLRGTGQSE